MSALGGFFPLSLLPYSTFWEENHRVTKMGEERKVGRINKSGKRSYEEKEENREKKGKSILEINKRLIVHLS